MEFLIDRIKWVYNEFGLASLYITGIDAWLIILSRCCRMFAYGANSLILAVFFSALEFTDFHIGIFMTLTLLGDLILSLGLTMIADRVGRRKILFLGSVLMVLSGATFAVAENFWILLFAAVIGVISATGSDFGPFRAIEESTLSHLTTPKTRSDVLAWYVTTASLGSSVGTEISGRLVDYLKSLDGWSPVDAYHSIWYIYVMMGSLNMLFTFILSSKCEAERPHNVETEASERLLDEDRSQEDEDEAGRIVNSSSSAQHNEKPKRNFFTQISKETRWIMYKLWFLLGVDALADGMTPYSLTIYYMDTKFEMAKSTLGNIISAGYFLSSCSTVFAGPLANRIGLINTMVFTHLPSSAAVLIFPAPRGLVMTVILFFMRTGLNNMDQAPRAAFIAAVVKPEERTAVMGITNMLRTLASTTGPSVTGLLAGNNRFWIAFVAAGALRILYDLGLWAMFINMKLYKHEKHTGTVTEFSELRNLEDEELSRPSEEPRPDRGLHDR